MKLSAQFVLMFAVLASFGMVVLAEDPTMSPTKSANNDPMTPGVPGILKCSDMDDPNADPNGFRWCPKPYEMLSNIDCGDKSLRSEDVQCNRAPFKGTFVCREFSAFLFFKQKHSFCIPDVTNGVLMGLEDDECGCCDGACKVCACTCEPGKHLIQSQWGLGLATPNHCVSEGFASHIVNWGGRAKCVEASECEGQLIKSGYLTRPPRTRAPTESPAPTSSPAPTPVPSAESSEESTAEST